MRQLLESVDVEVKTAVRVTGHFMIIKAGSVASLAIVVPGHGIDTIVLDSASMRKMRSIASRKFGISDSTLLPSPLRSGGRNKEHQLHGVCRGARCIMRNEAMPSG
jgi:hypothetical protein